MKVWLALTGLVCAVGGQYSQGTGHDPHPGRQPGYLLQPAATSLHVPQALPSHVRQYDPSPRYTYSYGVHVPTNGDVKDHTESRDGDVVRGSYSVLEPDGTMRIVDYTADPVHGFNAVVRNTPVNVQAAVQTPVYVQTPANVRADVQTPVHVQMPVQTPVYVQTAFQTPVVRDSDALYPALLYVSSETSGDPTSPSTADINRPSQYAAPARPGTPTNEISYSISYQTPSSTRTDDRYQYVVGDAYTSDRSPYPIDGPSRNDARTRPAPLQSGADQQTSYYRFRMTQYLPADSQRSTQSPNPSGNSQVLDANDGFGHTSYSNAARNTDSSLSADRATVDNRSLLGLLSYSDQRTSNRDLSGSNGGRDDGYSGAAYHPTATPANAF